MCLFPKRKRYRQHVWKRKREGEKERETERKKEKERVRQRENYRESKREIEISTCVVPRLAYCAPTATPLEQ